ncbi:MAG: asparagine synthase (glutamine-hydrolyzing) [Chloroflexi bacterium]|nr:MAG: asparagine synthase (glutamine-hydrolyzing) [Chloroflexota bacterium]
MCGIAGIYAFPNGQPVERPEIAAQTAALFHRGPNQGGIHLDDRRLCGLGARRLSIIDLQGGHQPLTGETGAISLVFNGEIYNHQALRAELEQAGHRFRSRTDGEVIIHGYEAWGIDGLLPRLRGMFTFALWDSRAQTLWLARDRFGFKPLYYTLHRNRLHFASEIKALLTCPDLPRQVNLTALEAMLTVGFTPGPATMFDGIFSLPAAHLLEARPSGIRVTRYWRLDFAPRPIPQAEAETRFLALLEEAVRLRLMSEVPLGALLSGGLDSGMLVALLVRQLDRPLHTVSIGFDHPQYDETPHARTLARHLGTLHHPAVFGPADFADYPTALHHLEQPQCSATMVPIYKLYRTCRQVGLTVVLTGEGADELLGGYHWHQGDLLARRLVGLPSALRHWLASLPLPVSPAARRVLARGQPDPARRYRDWLAAGDMDGRALLSGAVRAALPSGDNPLLAAWAEELAGLPRGDTFHQLLWLEARTRLVDFINAEVDKMSMAHSIEARAPYLDHKLWEFCAGLPARWKLHGRTTKYLLRQVARPILPPAIRQRAKQGLAAPYADWLRARRLPDWAEESLSAAAVRAAGYFDAAAVARLRQAHQAGAPGLAGLLMGVLSFQVWYGLFCRGHDR